MLDDEITRSKGVKRKDVFCLPLFLVFVSVRFKIILIRKLSSIYFHILMTLCSSWILWHD